MIGYYKVVITAKKTGEKIAELEVVGSTKEAMENEDFYKKRAMGNSGRDYTLEKWNIEKFTFTAELLKSLDNEVTIK